MPVHPPTAMLMESLQPLLHLPPTILILGAAVVAGLPSASGPEANTDEEDGTNVCYFPDGSVAPQHSYMRCSPKSHACCPDGTTCTDNGLCVEAVDDYGILVIRGACTSDGDDCTGYCSEHADTMAYLNPCGDTRFCCSSSPLSFCCNEKTFLFDVKGGSLAVLMAAENNSSEDGDGGGDGDYDEYSYNTRWTPPGAAATNTIRFVSTSTVTESAATNRPVYYGSGEYEDKADSNAPKLMAIGVGLGVGLTCMVLGIVFLCWKRRRRRRMERDAAAAKPEEGRSENPSSSSSSSSSSSLTPVLYVRAGADAGGSGVATAISSSGTSSSTITGGSSSSAALANSRSDPGPQLREDYDEQDSSSLPPAPPYSPPEYESGHYQYLVVDGPAPGSGNAGGGSLPIGEDGKPRLEG